MTNEKHEIKSHVTWLLLAISALACMVNSSFLLATPTVEGNLISWPDDGWYQVQSTDTYASICSGTRSCTVDPGDYIVINHTTGERFEPVRVRPDAPIDEDFIEVLQIEVQGGVISWPKDGWYQVQRTADYTTVCEGGQSCFVQPGSYAVINHTLGVRHENIVVGDGDGDVMVDGNVILWNGDGWFQVQNADDYSTVCEGEINSCETGVGQFQLINLRSGQRWEGLQVPVSTDPNVGENSPLVNLRGVVYTDSEIELFWDRLDEQFQVTAYRIWRDGIELDTRDALSFYENGLASGRTYLYEVAPVSGSNEIGPRTSIELTTFAAADIINDDNVGGILRFIASVINEELFKQYASLIDTVTHYGQTDTTNSTNDGFEYIESIYFPPDSSPFYVTHYYRCVANDGKMSVGRSLSLQQYGGDVDFEQCSSSLVDDKLVHGSARYDWTLIKNVYNPGSQTGIQFEGLTFQNVDDSTQTINASLNVYSGENNIRVWRGNEQDDAENDYVGDAFEGATSIIIEELFRSSGTTKEDAAPAWSRRLRASFTVQSPQTGNRPIIVSTDEEFVASQNDGCFDSGVLKATGADGSWLKVDAGNLDADTFELTVYANDMTTKQTIQWTADNMFMQLAGAQSTATASTSSACSGFYLPIFQ